MKARRGIAAQFTALLLVSGMGCVMLFFLLRFTVYAAMKTYFSSSDFYQRTAAVCVEKMQTYIAKENLRIMDSTSLMRWGKGHHVVLMEMYKGGRLLYSSLVPDERAHQWSGSDTYNSPLYEMTDHYMLTFADGCAEVTVFCDPTSSYYALANMGLLILCVMLFLLIFLTGCRRIVRYIYRLSAEIQAMEAGDLDHPITLSGNNELTTLASCLDSMRITLREQMREQTESAAKVKNLVTEMSHDLRTPLTTMLLYTEILRTHKYETDAQRDDYLEKIAAKGRQLKQMSDNLFEYALVTRDTTVSLDSPAFFSQIFEEPLAEMVDTLQQRGFTCALELGEDDVLLQVNAQYVHRILDNITSNIFKYADPADPISVQYKSLQGQVSLRFSNRILTQPAAVSTKVGLSSIKTMMEKMHAQSDVQQTDAQFSITLVFPPARAQLPQRDAQN